MCAIFSFIMTRYGPLSGVLTRKHHLRVENAKKTCQRNASLIIENGEIVPKFMQDFVPAE